jgi:oxygen-independent coproporphyrinogen-3 oxidase
MISPRRHSALDISDDDIRALVQRYSTRGPRYTSYPTAPQWTDAVNADVYRDVLREYEDPSPIALYTHIPFCRRLCLYCACNIRITNQEELVARYVRALKREVECTADLFGHRPYLAQMHFGGGTPTYLEPEVLGEVIDHLDAHFDSIPGAERSIEVDPRVTTVEHLEMLRSRGFQRISAGVQDLDQQVQETVKREYTKEQLNEFVAHARRLGFQGVNLDLIYGLPFQTEETWQRTLDSIIAIRPDRLAVFGYAHVPWKEPHQKSLERFGLPGAEERLSLAIQCRRAFVEAGYLAIGLDHFALPEDDMAIAFTQGTVHRNFMGYTVQDVDTMVAFGVSAIGDFPAAYVHNNTVTDQYIPLVEEHGLAVTQGHLMSPEDRLRRRLIVRLMGNFHIIPKQIEDEFGIRFEEHFAPEIEQLDQFVEAGVLRREDSGWYATLEGTFVVRNIAMIFDRYLEDDRDTANRYSRTI